MVERFSVSLIWLIYIAGAIYYNHLHREKYEELMAYLRYHHPQVARQMELKPILGFLYRGGGYGPSIRYARKHDPLNDHVAEELLADYARLSDKGIWLALVGLVLAMVLVIVFSS